MMAAKPDPLTADRIRMATSRSDSRLRTFCKKAADAYGDVRQAARKLQQECRTCFYLDAGRIVGRAIMTYTCAGCQQEDQYPNTGVPVLCAACAEIYEVCRHCCADMEYRDRESVEIK